MTNENKTETVITAWQCRAAREAVGWNQRDLAKAAKVSLPALANFERGATQPYESTMAKIRRALERKGVEFIPENGGGAGVRLKKRGGKS